MEYGLSACGESWTVPYGAETNTTPYGSGTLREPLRSQQVYAASNFPTGQILLITELRFQPDIYYGYSFTSSIPSIEIHLSTTQLGEDELGYTFADNVGTNDLPVFMG
jgi:hypothetical protein